VVECVPCPVFASFTLEFTLQLRKKHGKTSVRVRKTSVRLRKTSVIVQIREYRYIYRVSQEECAKLRESVPYVKVYRYNPKNVYPKLNGYGDNSQRKVGASCGSKYCNPHS
jgi:hypothetical protein